ncbi:MAG: hypothetical protein M3Y65_15840 [Pseudomonadota bacterium]|nr:hypothetical protein [Pseudomonadota bacterium]
MKKYVKHHGLALLLAASMPMAAHAHDFPTADRVEYVLECMVDHQSKQEYLYKCSCAIDQIAQQMPYDDYVESSTALRHQTLSGPRGAEFRDAGAGKAMAVKYKALQDKARKACYVQ